MIEEVKKICKLYDIKPSRNKGQNFLVNKEVYDNIVNISQLDSGDVVLEVGPGLGFLTQRLARKVNKVIAVELDKKIYDFLKVQFVNQGNVELINMDILKFRPQDFGLKSYKIVANLPYNISAVFLRKFLSVEENKPVSVTLMLQKEVVERICARPGEMSMLAVSVQTYCQPKKISEVGKNNFYPQPEVDSAVVFMQSIKSNNEFQKILGDLNEKFFWQTIKIGFSARRKQLQNNLSAGFRISSDVVKNCLIESKLSEKIRAQDLSVNDWIVLAKKIKNYCK